MSEWISVKERRKLPKAVEHWSDYGHRFAMSARVLVYEGPDGDGRQTGVLCWEDGKITGWAADPYGIKLTKVTHWQPLPEPPEEQP